MDTVENQWDSLNEKWMKRLISGNDMNQIIDVFLKQSAELGKKLRIWQKILEELNSAAVKKEESFSGGLELAESEDELHLVEVKILDYEASEVDISTKTEGCVDVLLQVEQLQLQYQFDEVNAVKNRSVQGEWTNQIEDSQ